MNLDYEWGVIQGRYPYRWTIWVCNFHPWEVDRLHLAGPYLISPWQIYSTTRLTTFIAVIFDLVLINAGITNCEVCSVLYIEKRTSVP